MKNIRAIVFDMDGVLTDSEPVINRAAIAALAEYGITARPEEFLPFVGTGDLRYIAGVAELHGATFIPTMKERMYAFYFDILKESSIAFHGVHELLAAIDRKGLKRAVASAADRVKVEANLRSIGVDPAAMHAVLCAEDVTKKKPDPEIYRAAARRLALDPAECCVIEDALNGIRAARAAGAHCIAVTTSFPRKVLEAEGPDMVVGSLAVIERMIAET